MAIYVTSDLHGLPIETFKCLLGRIGFQNRDWLYILGDVIDRNNDGGVGILRWLLEQPNVQLLRGNHEQMMLSCAFAFEKVTEESLENLSAVHMEALGRWMANGASPTLAAMRRLLHTEPRTVEDILEYLRDTPFCESVEIGDKAFLLCHAGFENFDKSKKFSDYSEDELLWNRPGEEERYFDDVLVVMGHTPTEYYGCGGRAFFTDTWVDIDVGGSMGAPPMFLRLDDGKEFYFDKKEIC